MFNENQKKIALWLITLKFPAVLATTFMVTHMNVFYARLLEVSKIGTANLIITVLLAVIGIILARDGMIKIAQSILKTALYLEIAMTCVSAYFILVDPYTALIISAVVAGLLFPIKDLGLGAEVDQCFQGKLRTLLYAKRRASNNIAAAMAAVIIMVFNEIPVEALAISVAGTCVISNILTFQTLRLLRKENMRHK